MKKIYFFILAIALFSMSCKGKKKSTYEITPLEKGKIIENVACINDKTQSYALYLPTYYNDSAKLPIIFAFDAHAKGLLPVELFKDDAEKFGYILVASNNSKNGTAWPVTSAIFDTLLSEANQRFSIDNNRIYTCGFSGGSRVASTLALANKNIKGVIGCGAGFSSIPERNSSGFDFFGIAGYADFNHTEMVQLAAVLDIQGIRNYLLSFNGKHEWPPKAIAHQAILWLELNAMKDKLKTKNDTLINDVLKNLKAEYTNLSKNPYHAYLICTKAISYLKGLCDISFFEKEKLALSVNTAVVQMQKHIKEIETKETQLQNKYASALSSQTSDWWTTQTIQLANQSKTDSDTLMQTMYSRVLSYLSLAAYMNASGIIKKGNYTDALSALKIYGIIDPENPEYAYLSAVVETKLNHNTGAIAFLEKAAELGFNDVERFDTDTTLLRLTLESGYSVVREKIIKNKN